MAVDLNVAVVQRGRGSLADALWKKTVAECQRGGGFARWWQCFHFGAVSDSTAGGVFHGGGCGVFHGGVGHGGRAESLTSMYRTPINVLLKAGHNRLCRPFCVFIRATPPARSKKFVGIVMTYQSSSCNSLESSTCL